MKELRPPRQCTPPINNQTLLANYGHLTIPSDLPPDQLEQLKQSAFPTDTPGRRCLLDDPTVAAAAIAIRQKLDTLGLLPPEAIALQAIAFDKSPTANWKVTWHQDLMFPFARQADATGFTLACQKEGIDYARPPVPVLENLLAARLHLDDCGLDNGPLRVAPGTHHLGIVKATDIPPLLARHGETTCLADAGDCLLLKPLLLHASSPASKPRHRRVLHIVYHSGPPLPIPWHRAI